MGILRDENGKFSSTRLILIVTTVVFAMCGITDIYRDIVVHDGIYDIIATIYGFGLGGQAIRSGIKNYVK